MRDFNKAAQEGEQLANKRSGLDIKASELTTLYKQFVEHPDNDSFYEAVSAAYYAGLAIGYRNK